MLFFILIFLIVLILKFNGDYLFQLLRHFEPFLIDYLGLQRIIVFFDVLICLGDIQQMLLQGIFNEAKIKLEQGLVLHECLNDFILIYVFSPYFNCETLNYIIAYQKLAQRLLHLSILHH
ncbi:hypothetical protein FGO68_gene1622 [Halteria grandinella]|uniref:Uncharacterized protein n=1 Tax=Halteria grandinella TaxID=5974 RepID=A0A8J8SUT9_HALGN|nr:hypothetical protein FGO68_gene1622 [Halteria grandinella]